MEYQPNFGLLGAGAVSASLIGRLAVRLSFIGPVAGTSYRVASRIANTLNAGPPLRSPDELDSVRQILFHAPPEQMLTLLDLLRRASIVWAGKSLIFCDCQPDPEIEEEFRRRGASVALVRACPIPGRLVVQGLAPALNIARSLTRQLAMKPIELPTGSRSCFEAAITLGSGALTPLIDHAADLLRACGIRDSEAPELAAALFAQTARDYAHSGKQSWTWHVHGPASSDLEAQIAALGDRYGPVLRELILLGLDTLDKHADVACALRKLPLSQ